MPGESKGGNVGFLFRLFLIFIIAYSIYSIIMFVLRLVMRHDRSTMPPRHEDERIGRGGSRKRAGGESNSVIELDKDQYKVE